YPRFLPSLPLLVVFIMLLQPLKPRNLATVLINIFCFFACNIDTWRMHKCVGVAPLLYETLRVACFHEVVRQTLLPP
ncbi:hypothetical protein, partial [Nostoc sp.]|uniref:hypothetical protein n=1 Tax=Nostoc sp. TaxID=1180 RepID=UPI002FF878F3